MNKELNALEDIILYLNATEPKGLYCKNIEIIKAALKEYDSLKEENKSLKDSLENLDEIYFDTWCACEKLKKNSDYALMFVDGVYCLVDTKDNKFDVIDNYEIDSKGIIKGKKCEEPGVIATYESIPIDINLSNKLKALEIIKVVCPNIFWVVRTKTYKEYKKKNSDDTLLQEEYDLLKEVLE